MVRLKFIVLKDALVLRISEGYEGITNPSRTFSSTIRMLSGTGKLTRSGSPTLQLHPRKTTGFWTTSNKNTRRSVWSIWSTYNASMCRYSSYHVGKRKYPRGETVVPSLGTGVLCLATGSCNSYV